MNGRRARSGARRSFRRGVFERHRRARSCAREAADFRAGILLVGHDAQPHGAQLLLLHLARKLKRQWGIEVHLLLLGVGPLLGPYYETAEVSVAYDKTIIGNLLDKYRAMGIRTAIVNSAASARVVPWLEQRGIKSTLLVHEMPQLLKEYNLEIQARLGGGAATNLVFSSSFLRGEIFRRGGFEGREYGDPGAGQLPGDALRCGGARAHSPGTWARGGGFSGPGRRVSRISAKASTCSSSSRAKSLACAAMCISPGWGTFEFMLKTYLGPEMAQAAATGNFHHIPFTDRVAEYFSAADVLALTSREDPYPTVVMEALACGVPCVAFDEAGGIPELLRREKAGRVAKLADVDDFLAQLASLLDHEKLDRLRPRAGGDGAEKI